ncbi:MAG: toprim domain-containing protein [Alphaproteobacteria bacterium]|nr:toprim domain-containing protein [Alphaproteobacteria bacterium]
MTLHRIVAAVGGDLYSDGRRANIPAPGHSARDRSVSLLLTDDRVVIHGFGGSDWRIVRDHLRSAGLIDHTGRLIGGARPGPSAPRPDLRVRLQTASDIWAGCRPLYRGDAGDRHLRHRAVAGVDDPLNLGCHPEAPISVYRPRGRGRPALIARISDAQDRLTAVEVTYLDRNGRLASGLRLTRKTVGQVPSGAAVRLAPVGPEMLVGEGVVTTLSAMDRFQLPGWALMAANNLAAWTPPSLVRRLLIAADRGAAGERAAERLRRRLAVVGLDVRIRLPDPPFGDWNEVAVDAAKVEERGR